jgi:hypothetical protein
MLSRVDGRGKMGVLSFLFMFNLPNAISNPERLFHTNINFAMLVSITGIKRPIVPTQCQLQLLQCDY